MVVCAHLQCIWEQVRHVAGLYLSNENVYYFACMSLAGLVAFLFYIVFAIDCMFSIDFEFLNRYFDSMLFDLRTVCVVYALALRVQHVFFVGFQRVEITKRNQS